MGRSVAVRRAVAASDLAALEADPQVNPAIARLQAVLAAVDRLGELGDQDVVEMVTGHCLHRPLSLAGTTCPSWRHGPCSRSPSRKKVGVPWTPACCPVSISARTRSRKLRSRGQPRLLLSRFPALGQPREDLGARISLAP